MKRFDELGSAFEKAALLLAFVNLFVAIWVRTPALQLDPASAVGLSVSGFNVGHAIVFGPVVAAVTAAIYLTQVNRKLALREIVLAVETPDVGHLTPGKRYALGNYGAPGRCWIDVVADRAWRGFWYFSVPPLAALACLLRHCDFVSDEAAKAGSTWDRIQFLFFSFDSWFHRPILPCHSLEKTPGLMEQLPYVYGPWQSWAELGLVLLSVVPSWRAAAYTFSKARTPVGQN